MLKIILLVLFELICVIHYTHSVQAINTKKPKKVTIRTTQTPRTKERYYNPNYGYEPYWPGGDWIISENPEEPTTTPPPMVCGTECHYMFRKIKKVCARHVDNKYLDGCHMIKGVKGCYGDPPDNLVKGYETVNTYCEFLDKRCRSAENTRPPLYKWILVHLGECETNQDLTFKPLMTDEPKQRMKEYLKKQKEVFKKLKRTPCF